MSLIRLEDAEARFHAAMHDWTLTAEQIAHEEAVFFYRAYFAPRDARYALELWRRDPDARTALIADDDARRAAALRKGRD